MDDSFLVRELRRVGDLSSDLPGVIERHSPFGDSPSTNSMLSA